MSKLGLITFLFVSFFGFSQSEYKVDSLPYEVNLLGKDTVYSFKKGRLFPYYVNVLKSKRELRFEGVEILYRKDNLYFLNITRYESKRYDSIRVYSGLDTMRLRLMPGNWVRFGLFLNDKRIVHDSVSVNSLRSHLHLKAIHQEGNEIFEYYFPKPRAKFNVEFTHMRRQVLVDFWEVNTKGKVLISDEKIKDFQDGDFLGVIYWVNYRKISYRPIECMSSLTIKR